MTTKHDTAPDDEFEEYLAVRRAQNPDFGQRFADAMADMRFGTELALLRMRRGWSQRELAARIGTSQSTIALYEKGERSPNLRNQARIAKALNADIVILCSGGVRLEDRLKPAKSRPIVNGSTLASSARSRRLPSSRAPR
ncbi:MAG: helix-turn-helix transcriptional regulator [Chloroflexi bacterium]|nr:helix-turn-helix transcriptional regulator [Chloroflexota bacterium]